MTTERTIKVSQETYERLEAEARSRALSVEGFLERIIVELDKLRERVFIEHLRAEGMIVSFPPTEISIPPNFKPVPVEGKPVSQTIIEDREPR